MRRQDLVSILLTFLIGFALGVYVYITGFAGFLERVVVPDAADTLDYVIVADAYGGCARMVTCPSFRVDSTGAYTYIYPVNGGEEKVTRTGRLPLGLRQELRNALSAQALVRQSQPTTPAMCESYRDGIDVRYTITTPDGEYQLNSCGTAVAADSELWRALSRVWDVLEAN